MKGLEPEVQRILAQHQAQVQQLKREAADALEQEKQRHREEMHRLGGDSLENHAR